jgi:hypothetical protein
MPWVQDTASLLLILPDSARKFGFADARRAHGLYDGKLGRNLGLDRNRHQTAATRLCSRQGQIPRRIGEQCKTKRFLGLCVSISLVITLGDRLRYIRETHDNAVIFAGLKSAKYTNVLMATPSMGTRKSLLGIVQTECF